MNEPAWWLPPARHWERGATLHLLALPHAGGSPAAYQGWLRGLPRGVQVAACQWPGRGARFSEASLTDWPSLLAALGAAVQALGDVPVVLFGHSVGALVAYELAHWLDRHGCAPAALVVSGCRAPQLPARHAPWAQASDAALVEWLQRLGGTPPEALRQPELLALMLPALRADGLLHERYAYRPRPPLATPLTVFGGLHDPLVEPAALAGWAAHSRGGCRLHTLPGGHFYLHEPTFLTHLNATLREVADRPPASPTSAPSPPFPPVPFSSARKLHVHPHDPLSRLHGPLGNDRR